MKQGIYQTIHPHTVEEQHGGGNIQHKIYWSLCFYSNSRVGLFGGNKDYFDPYFKLEFDLNGEVVEVTDNYLEIFILNPFTNIKRIYKGRIEGNRLYLKYYLEDKPKEISEDVFEYISDIHQVQTP